MSLSKKIIFIIFSILVSSYVYYIINETEIMKNLKEVGQENLSCENIDFEHQIEDFVKINDTFIIGSSFDVPNLFNNLKYLKEDIPNDSLISYNTITKEIKKLKIMGFPKSVSFHPHGIDLYKDKYLYIINHSANLKKSFDEIELLEIIFDEKNNFKTLKYQKSFKLPYEFFTRTNTILGLSLNTFYIVTYSPFRRPLNQKDNTFLTKFLGENAISISLIFHLKKTYMYYYENGNLYPVISSAGMSNNGIVFDEKNKKLYLAQTIENQILVYGIDNNYINPKLINKIKTGYSLDNLRFDKIHGKIYAAIIGSKFQFSQMQNSYKKFKNLEHVDNYFGGFISIDVYNKNAVKIEHLSNKKLIGISTGMYVDNIQIMSGSMGTGLLVFKKLK